MWVWVMASLSPDNSLLQQIWHFKLFERQREGKGKPLIYYMVLTLLLHPACIATDKPINANLILRSGLVHYFQHLLKRLPGSFHYLPLCLRALLTSAMPSGNSEQLICVTLCVSTNHLNVTHSMCTLCVWKLKMSQGPYAICLLPLQSTIPLDQTKNSHLGYCLPFNGFWCSAFKFDCSPLITQQIAED